MSVPDVANLVLSAAALMTSAVALRIARTQMEIDDRSLKIAERESAVAEQERSARSALVVATQWEPNSGVSRAVSLNAHFSVRIEVRKDGARDATDVSVAFLVPAHVHSASLHPAGVRSPRMEDRSIHGGRSLSFYRHECVLERVRRVPQELTGNVELWRGNGSPKQPVTTPVLVEVRCADQPPGQEIQVWEHEVQWIPPD